MATPDIGQSFTCAQCGRDEPEQGEPSSRRKYCGSLCAHAAAQKAWRLRNKAERPRSVVCSGCKCEVVLGARGRVPQYCKACLAQRNREAAASRSNGRTTGQRAEVAAKAREKARLNGVVPFAEMQRARTAASIAKRSTTCQACGIQFVAKAVDRLKVCSRQCAGELKKTKPPANSRVWFPSCRECDRVFATRLKAARLCSDECKATEARRNARARAIAAFVPLSLRCPECDNEFVRTYNDKGRRFCSQSCSKRHSSRAGRIKRKRTERAASVESVNPFKVFERDGWRCQCCKKPTPRDRRGTCHPRAPELDHIVPLSKGGEHSYRNTQLLCRACNAAKSDNDQGQQMRLFG